MPWATRLFSKSIKGKILNFLHEVEKGISVISQSLIEKIGFPFFKKNRPHFQGLRDKSKFFVQSCYLSKLAKLNFYF